MVLRLALGLLLLPLIGCPSTGTSDDDDTGSSGDCSDLEAAQNPPEVTLTAPPQSEIYTAGDSIPVLGTVTDEDTDPGDLSLELLEVINVTPEDIDIDLPDVGNDDSISFSIPAGTLEQGQHVIRLRVTDPDGCQGTDDRFFCIDTADCVDN
jgi:hypothetical protein